MKQNQPLISVIITSHNRPKTLRQTVKSIIAQTYSNLEIIICDDLSSNPEVLKVIDSLEHEDSRIKLIKSNLKQGPAGHFNSAKQIASGNYIAYFNDDDWIDSDYIEKCFIFLQENKNYNLVVGSTKFYAGDDYVGLCSAESVEEEDSISRFFSFHDKFLGTANCPNFGVYRKEKMLDIPMSQILGDDNIFISNIIFRGKLKTLATTFLHRRLGGLSESLSKTANSLNYTLFEKAMPFPALYINIINNIYFTSPNFLKFNLLMRVKIIFRFSLMLLLNMKKYLTRYGERYVHVDENPLPQCELELKKMQFSQN